MAVLLTSNLAHQSKGKKSFILVNANCGSQLSDVLLQNLADVPGDSHGEGFVFGYAGIAFSF